MPGVWAIKVRAAVPSVVTLAGLWLAVWAMALVVEGRHEAAAWALFAATMTDNIDGFLARALGADSPFGKQLDSLADVITAGAAPAFFIHQIYFVDRGVGGFVVAAFWATAVAARLARFNTTGAGSALFFHGVPCPIGATMITQYLVFSQARNGTDGSPTVVVVLVVVLSGLMLSPLPYWKTTTLLPRNFFKTTNSLGTTGMLVGLVFLPRQALFLTMVCSIALAVIEAALRRRLGGDLSDWVRLGRTAPAVGPSPESS